MLAVVTGSGWNVDEMAAQMPLPLLHEWLAFADLLPLLFDPDYAQARHDWNAGMMAASFINYLTALWAKGGSLKKEPQDLMYKPKPRWAVERQPTNKELYLAFKTAVLLNAPKQRKTYD